MASGRYVDFYGDIPRRPLFLDLVIDDVAASGVRPRGRARLLDEWVRRKIVRDVTAPTGRGKEGRIPIARGVDTVGTTLEVAYRSMKSAAINMTQVINNTVELLVTCSYESVISSASEFASEREPLGLVLNTVLMPVAPRAPVMPTKLRFAHRAFQEYSLALAVLDRPDQCGSAGLPSEVTNWIEAITDEGLAG